MIPQPSYCSRCDRYVKEVMCDSTEKPPPTDHKHLEDCVRNLKDLIDTTKDDLYDYINRILRD